MLPEFLHYGFVFRAILAGLILGGVLPVIGLFLVVRRYALFADTLSHVGLAGASIASFFSLPIVTGAIISSLAVGLGLEQLRRSARIGGDALLALFLSGGLAVAVIVATMSNAGRGALIALLFGSISTVDWSDIIIIGTGSILVLTIVLALWRKLFFLSLDAELATASGLPSHGLSLLLTGATAVLIALSLPVVGALLIGALMVIPVLTAIQLHLDFRRTAIASVIYSFVSVSSGLVLSAIFNLPPGATIVLSGVLLFSATFLFATLYRRGR